MTVTTVLGDGECVYIVRELHFCDCHGNAETLIVIQCREPYTYIPQCTCMCRAPWYSVHRVTGRVTEHTVCTACTLLAHSHARVPIQNVTRERQHITSHDVLTNFTMHQSHSVLA